MRRAVWYRARAELRRHWRSTVVLAVLAGVAGGVVLAGVAGARRTATAMDRFVEYNRTLDVFLEFEPGTLDEDAVAALPMVAGTGKGAYVLVVPSRPDGSADEEEAGGINGFLLVDETGVDLDRPLVVEGRLPDPDEALEVTVDEELAEDRGVGPGDTLRIHTVAPEELEATDDSGDVATGGPAIDLAVTAVIRTPNDVDPRDDVGQDVIYTGSQDVYFGEAWYERFGDRVAMFGPDGGLEIKLRRGQDDAGAFRAAVERLPGGKDVQFNVGDSEAESARRASERAIRGGAGALLAFAALAAMAGLVVVGQAQARALQLESGEVTALRAVGLGRAALAAVALVRSLAVGALAVAVAVPLAVALSPLLPLGLAQRAEIDPGVDVDLPVLALGALALVALIGGRGLLTGVRLARSAGGADRSRPSRAAERLAAAGAPAPLVTGVRLAVERGRAWTAIGGVALAAGSVVAAGVFASSLDQLEARPDLQGWNWDVVVGNGQVESIEDDGALLEANPLVGGWSAVGRRQAGTVDGEAVEVLPVGTGEGPTLTVTEGRAPAGAGEVALGQSTFDDLGAEVGDSVTIEVEEGRDRFVVVGTVVVNDWQGVIADLGRGALVTLDRARALGVEPFVSQFVVDYAEGADQGDVFRSLRSDFGRTVLAQVPAVGVQNLRRIESLPVALAALVAVLALAALVAVLALAALAHALVTGLRRRRGDLAVLRTIGFLRRQLGATVVAFATTTVVLAAVAGLPVGVAVGRWAWRAVADGLGIPAAPVVPVAVVALTLPVALLVANAVAAFPARMAARTHPASALRAE